MRTIIKFAGALLEDEAVVRDLARQVVALAHDGLEILVVHGGGRLFTATLQRMGIESKFTGGLRITDRETRDVAVMVFAGLLNKRLAAAITVEGHAAVGISAADAACFTAEPMVHNEVTGGLGYVGYLTGLNTEFIESLWRENLLPVAPCLGLGADNEVYNINADHMAAACAEYLADVPGVLDGERVLSTITCEEVERLAQCHVVSGGMVLKLEAAKRAIEGHVRDVRIVGGTTPDALLRAAHASETACDIAPIIPGTRVLREPVSTAQAALSAA